MELETKTLIEERNKNLPELISSLTLKEGSESLKQINATLQYLKTYDVKTAEREIIKYVMPAITNNFKKICEDSLTLLHTADDEFISVLIKENIKISVELTKIVDSIILFILEEGSINLVYIESVIKYVPHYIELFFQYFKRCGGSYVSSFEKEYTFLMEVVQSLHFQFLKLLETCTSGEDDHSVILLSSTLIALCKLTETFSDVDINLIVRTLKHLTTMTEKYAEILENVMDLIVPIDYVTIEIQKISTYLLEHDESFSYKLKYLGFLFKIVMKLCDNFCRVFDKMSYGIVSFFLKTFNFSLDSYKSSNLPDEAVHMIEEIMPMSLKHFLHQLLKNHDIFQVQVQQILCNADLVEISKEYPLGLLTFLNMNLKIGVQDDDISSEFTCSVIASIFSTLNECHKELFFKSCKEGLFNDLVLDISAAILTKGNDENTECLLIKNILLENPFGSLLALEVYTLVLSNSSINEVTKTLTCLLNKVKKVNFGLFTRRPETIYFKELLKRILNTLPITFKMDIINVFKLESNFQLWKFLGLDFNVLSEGARIDFVNNTILNMNIKSITSREQFIHLAHNLSLLSTVDLSKNSVDIVSFVLEIYRFWEFDSSFEKKVIANNVSRCFITILVKLTTVCLKYFSLQQLNLIFSKLSTISNIKDYKVYILEIIKRFPSISMNMQDVSLKGSLMKILQELLSSSSSLLREITIEALCENFSGHHFLDNIIKSLDNNMSSKDARIYLQKEYNETVNYEDFTRTWYTHVCLTWYDTPYCKMVNTLPHLTNASTNKREQVSFPSESRHYQHLSNSEGSVGNSKYILKNDDMIEIEDCVADDTIQRLKSEVKCLSKIVKTEKLTTKNVSDLRVILSQLSSLI